MHAICMNHARTESKTAIQSVQHQLESSIVTRCIREINLKHLWHSRLYLAISVEDLHFAKFCFALPQHQILFGFKDLDPVNLFLLRSHLTNLQIQHRNIISAALCFPFCGADKDLIRSKMLHGVSVIFSSATAHRSARQYRLIMQNPSH